MKAIFEAILFDPLFNVFVGLYNIIPDVGVVILIITVVIKLILFPLTKKSIVAQKSMRDLQPKLNEIKKKYKGNQQKLAEETMKVYKENKINPLGSCLPILVQLPIFLALYWVLRAGLTTDSFEALYPFISAPEFIDVVSFGIVNLGEPSIILALLAGGAQFWHAKSMVRKRPPKKSGEGAKDEDMMAMVNKQMLYFMPVLTIIISFQLPGGLALYWFLSTFITALQQHFIFNKKSGKGKPDAIEGKIVS